MMPKDQQYTEKSFWPRLRMVLGHPAILFWTLPYLMVLLIIGTLEQTRLGLYAAQTKFFGSLVFTLGPVPLPGGLLVCGLLFVNLLVKFLWDSEWSVKRSGVHLAHIGVIVLLLGGLFSNLSREEWVITLPPNVPVQEAADYFESEIVLLKNGKQLETIDFKGIQAGSMLFNEAAPFAIKVLNICHSCQIIPREGAPQSSSNAVWRGPGAGMALIEGKSSLKAEENLQGLSVEISGIDEERDGNYVNFLFFPKPPLWKIGNDEYSLVVRRTLHSLPFTLKLTDFKAVYYPGTEMAKSYSSDVQVQYENKSYPFHIAMNTPLSTDLYTVYQSSYYQNAQGEAVSVLTAVKNRGRYFPYVGTLLIALGLIIHLIFRARAVRQEMI